MTSKPLRRWLFALALSYAALASPAAAADYTITTLDLPGPAGTQGSQGFDVNGDGVFVGTASSATDSVGYLVAEGAFITLPGPAGALGSSALGISEGGVVVGSYYTTHLVDATGATSPGPQTGFIFASGTYTSFAAPGFAETVLRGISADGRYLTGYANDAGGAFTAFVYDRTLGSFTPIAEASAISIAQGVTNAGLVVGNHYSVTTPVVRSGFTFDTTSGVLTLVQLPGALDTRLRAISEGGVIAGSWRDGSGFHGFVGSLEAFDTLNVADATDTFVEGINEAGWLAGIYASADGLQHAFLAVPVPEPASWALMLGGVVLIAWRRRH